MLKKRISERSLNEKLSCIDKGFLYLHNFDFDLYILSDPRGWSKEDVTTWVDFTVQNNGLPNPNERFSILYPLQTFSPSLTFLFLHKLLLKLIFLAPTGAL